MILKPTKIIPFALFSFLLCSPLNVLSGEAEDAYWWANAYGQTENISKETAVRFFKYIIDTRKNLFYNKTHYDGLIKQFKNPKDKLYNCRELYEASIK